MRVIYSDDDTLRWPRQYVAALKLMLEELNYAYGRGHSTSLVFKPSYKSYPIEGYVRRTFQYGADYKDFRIITGPDKHKVKFVGKVRVFWETGR